MVAGVDQLPAQELRAVDVDRDRVEHLDVLGVAVVDRVGEHDVVADRVLVMVPVLGQPVAVFGAGHEAHVVLVEDVKRRVASRLGELGLDVMQRSDVVNLVEPVDDCLVADRHLPLEHFEYDHVVHLEATEVGDDLGADPVR